MNAQIFGIIEPAYQRFGIVYNKEISNFGVYGKIWWGQITKQTEFAYFHTWNYKLSIGGAYKFKDNTSLYIGINQNYFYRTTKNDLFNIENIHKTSFEIGWGTLLTKRIEILAITDLLNWETCFGINFKLKKR